MLVKVENIVPGDIISLEPGDSIPADIRFIKADNLTIDESVLTGEAVPVEKTENPLSQETKDTFKATNIGFSGTTVVSGKAYGVVFATGKNTQFGGIAKLTLDTTRQSTFEKELAKFSQFILRLVIGTIVLLLIANLTIKRGNIPFGELAVFSVALAVSVIPEALPLVISFSLSRGAIVLAKKKVVVRRLSAIEDLGSIEILTTDKTGTITENKLTIEDYYGDDKEILTLANLASAEKLTNPFDICVWEEASDTIRKEIKSFKKLTEIPFDPKRRRTTAIVEKNGKKIVISRGAPEDVLRLTTISESEKKKIDAWIKDKGKSGMRILAVAQKKSTGKKTSAITEKDMMFVGLISFVDPLKPSTIKAVKDAQNLGVRIKILTGDALDVAKSVGLKTGLIVSDEEAITGDEFEKFDAITQKNLAEKIHVFARVTPQQKYNIIRILEQSHEVGFVGEGINDAPALKTANVALVVDGASDIARDAADIVLLKKDLEVIVEGIREGRKVFTNTRKYVTATLASNFGNFYAVAIASLIVDFLPMLPLQILLENLLTDFPMISIATDNVDPKDIQKPKRYDVRRLLVKATVLGIVSTIFDFLFFAIFVRQNPANLQTAWFMGSILTELIFLFSIRTKKLFLQTVPPSGIILLLTTIAGLTAITLPYLPVGHDIFKFTSLNSSQLTTVGFLVILYFVSTETVKLGYQKIASRDDN
jgi:Mg2+-importing ATPase